jgi:hypothetical protein
VDLRKGATKERSGKRRKKGKAEKGTAYICALINRKCTLSPFVLSDSRRPCAVVPSPSDEVNRREVIERIREVYRRAAELGDPPNPKEIDGVFVVAAWFRRRSEERRNTLDPAMMNQFV